SGSSPPRASGTRAPRSGSAAGIGPPGGGGGGGGGAARPPGGGGGGGGARGRGAVSALLARLSAWATGLGYSELMGPVKELDDASLRWTERRGFVEVGRNSVLALDLTAIEAPEV